MAKKDVLLGGLVKREKLGQGGRGSKSQDLGGTSFLDGPKLRFNHSSECFFCWGTAKQTKQEGAIDKSKTYRQIQMLLRVYSISKMLCSSVMDTQPENSGHILPVYKMRLDIRSLSM